MPINVQPQREVAVNPRKQLPKSIIRSIGIGLFLGGHA
jgi:hypothetical protein